MDSYKIVSRRQTLVPVRDKIPRSAGVSVSARLRSASANKVLGILRQSWNYRTDLASSTLPSRQVLRW